MLTRPRYFDLWYHVVVIFEARMLWHRNLQAPQRYSLATNNSMRPSQLEPGKQCNHHITWHEKKEISVDI